jgi:putative transposase
VFDNIFVERLWRSVKHEDVYLKVYASMPELMQGLAEYFAFYNGGRPHQSLGQRTPDVVYRTGIGGGAMILDKFPRQCSCRGKVVKLGDFDKTIRPAS